MRNTEKITIGSRLWEYMKMNPMSITKLAAMIGIGRATLLSISNEIVEPRNEVRCKIEKFLKEQLTDSTASLK